MQPAGVLNKFNRGEVSRAALVREDVDKVRESAELMENWLPQRLGSMMRRPGFEVLEAVTAGVKFFDYQYATDDTALLEFGDSALRIWIDDAPLARTAVTTAVTNGDFSSALTGWTDASSGGASATAAGGYAVLTGGDTDDAVIHQTLTTQTGAEHGLRIVVDEAPVRLKIGTSGAQSDDITDSLLQPGTHSLAFTPSANVTLTLINDKTYRTRIASIAIEGAGVLSLPTPVPLANVDDVQIAIESGRIFASWSGEQFLIERRGTRSWGVADFRVDDGPFDTINLDDGLTLEPSTLKGNGTLTASKAHFKDPESVGTLRRVLSAGQTVTASVTAEDNGTGSVRVTGLANGGGRRIFYNITGSWSGTVTLQRSTDDAAWVDVDSFTANRSAAYEDGVDNAVYYYRLHVKPGDYTSGTIGLEVTYSGGGIEGICRITSVSSSTVANVQVLSAFGSTDASRDWYQTQWGDGAGFPNATALEEGRLYFAGKGGLWGSVSDAFTSFNRRLEGASASIYKAIGRGATDEVNWVAPAVRLALGLAGDEVPVRSSSFGEILTADNINLRQGPEVGSSKVNPVRLRNALYFADASGTKLYELVYAGGTDGFEGFDKALLNPDICKAGIAHIAVAHEPETRVFVTLADGAGRVMLVDRAEDIVGWSRITVDGGTIKQIVCNRASGESEIYANIAYGGTEYLCKLARMDQAATRPADLYTYYAGPIQVCTGLSRFEGETVEAWAGSVRRGTFTVSSGQIDLGASYSAVTVGKTITANYRSGKLGIYDRSTSLAVLKRVENLMIQITDLWHPTLKIGRNETRLGGLRSVVRGKTLDTSALIEEYDVRGEEFEGSYDSDSRIYIRATGPATVLAMSYDLDVPSDQARQAA